MLGDPRARRAYVLTKVGVLAAATLATWPLAAWIGPRAWYALGVFAVIIALITLAVLAAGAAASGGDEDEEPDDEDDEPPHPDPDLVVVLPVEDFIDLHPFPPRDVPDVVGDYLEEAHARGLHEVRLIHGRGIGVQRERVRSVLGRHPLVESFKDAPPERGGWGATVVRLRSGV